MKKVILSLLLISLISLYKVLSQTDSLYLGKTPPSDSKELFSISGVGPNFFINERIAITPNGKTIYYQETKFRNGESYKIKKLHYNGSSWIGPTELFTGYYSLALSPDADTLILENNGAKNSWISTKNGDNWHDPIRFLEEFEVHCLHITQPRNYYFASSPSNGIGNLDICKLNISASDTTLLGLGKPLNSKYLEGDFFIANDESYIIVMSNKPGGYGMEDLYISYKKKNDKWTNPKNLGAKVNTASYEYGPYVTNDNKYLFYSIGFKTPSALYWIAIKDIIDSLKTTNYEPYAAHSLTSLSDTAGKYFSYTLSDSIFFDDDGNHTLNYSATLSNGNELPDFLEFNSLTKTLEGKLTYPGEYSIRITASDTAGANATTDFNLTIHKKTTAIKSKVLRNINIHPNPAQKTIYLEKDHSLEINHYTISKINGSIIKNEKNDVHEIDMSDLSRGVYILNIYTKNGFMSKKIILN